MKIFNFRLNTDYVKILISNVYNNNNKNNNSLLYLRKINKIHTIIIMKMN